MAAVGAVLLLAVGLRLYHADAQSLWYDEGTSAALARRSLAEIARGAAGDIHPPLYYWLLAAWAGAFGDGVVALRAFSALAGTLVVGGVIAVGWRLWGPAVALLAGLSAAISPYLVWYSQEVRMYMLAAAWGAALVWLALALRADAAGAPERGKPGASGRLAGAPAWLTWAQWTVCATAALYTHYLAGASAVATANVVIGLGVGRAWRAGSAPGPRFLAAWGLANAVAGLLFAPWLRVAWPAIRDWPAQGLPVSVAQAVFDVLATYALRTPESAPIEGRAVLAALVFLAAVGAARHGRDGSRGAAAVAVAWAGTPLALLLAASAARPAWNPKFLIVGAPGFELLVGAGAAAVASAAGRTATALARRRREPDGRGHGRDATAIARATGPLCAGLVGALAVAAIAWPRARVLEAMYHDPAHQRDDYRGIAAAIAAAAGVDDAVILDAPTQVEVFGYYDRGRHRLYPLPRQRPPDPAATSAEVAAIAARHRDLYGVLWATAESDPAGIVEGWLNAHRYKAFDAWHGNVRLVMWAAARAPMTDRLPRSPAVFGTNEIVLARLMAGPPAVAAGGVVTLDAVWAAAAPPRADYTVFVHIVDAAGRLVAGRDMRPLGGSARTSGWAPVERQGIARLAAGDGGPVVGPSAGPAQDAGIVDHIGLVVPTDAAPGVHTIRLGLYDPATGARLAVNGGDGESAAQPSGGDDAVNVGQLEVRPPGP